MTETEAHNLRDDYLNRLDAAIAELPWRVANDLRSGIAEELDGLDAAAVRERIAQLGDPARIAAAAKEETSSAPPPPVVVVAPSPLPAFGAKPAMVDTKWFAIVGALVLGFGAVVFPIGGWVIGVGLVTSSRFWRRWEKAVAILLPFVAWVLMFFLSALLRGLSVWSSSDPRNPVIPTAYDLANVAVVLMILIPAGTLWLLWRLRGRDAPLR